VSAPLPATVLLQRIMAEMQLLDDAQRRVMAKGPGAAWLESVAGARLRQMVEKAHTELKALEEGIERYGVDAARLEKMAELQKATNRVASECLALALGSLARFHKLDGGACEQADLFIRELAGRVNEGFARPTVPGGEELLHQAADVIRRRVPDNGLWDLPIMAHEFGHLVASGLKIYDGVGDTALEPIKAFLEGFTGRRRQQVTELCCDVFATFALGPSYPCTLVLCRLDPTAPAVAKEDDTHPGPASRVHACLWTLRKLQGKTKFAGPYDTVIWQLKTAWEEFQQGAKEEARLDKEARGALGAELSGCWATLHGNLASVRYRWSGSVRDLAEELKDPEAEPALAERSAADVLNAAWMVRLDAWSDGVAAPAGLERRARRLLEAALGRVAAGQAKER
jgi:hypothetical protein